jgi:hypothetical protein
LTLTTFIAILTALGIGGILGGWVAARRERAESFRSRMIDTCTAFLEKQAEARGRLADVQAEVLDYMASADTQRLGTVARRDRLAKATGVLRELQTKSFLLDLFFPRTTGTASSSAEGSSTDEVASNAEIASAFAGNVVVYYWRWQQHLNSALKGELEADELLAAVQAIREAADEQHQMFCWTANRAIRGRAF